MPASSRRLCATFLLLCFAASTLSCHPTNPTPKPNPPTKNTPTLNTFSGLPSPSPEPSKNRLSDLPSPSPESSENRLPGLSSSQALARFQEAQQRGLPEHGLLVFCHIASQRLFVIDSTGVQFEYLMSSSKFGTGNRYGSNQTPLGWHRIAERIGGDQIQGRSFTSRRPDPVVLDVSQWRSNEGRDYVLTRILWLEGLEPRVNLGGQVDSHTRCIYIHGTNQEHLLGQPASHGCIRLSNRDVMELYDTVEHRESYCLIQ